MGQRFEKSKKNVTENRGESERINADSRTLREEYAPLDLLKSIERMLDDEAIEAIEGVKATGEIESQRLDNETRVNEAERKEIAVEIDREIAKLDDGLRKLRGADDIAFGARAIEQSKQEYRKQIEQFKALMGELDAREHGSSLGGSETSSTSASFLESTINDSQSIDESAKSASIAGYIFHSIASPHSDDVKKWNSYLDSISKDVRRLYSERYGRYITPGKLDIPLSETLVYETQELFESKGLGGGVLGYNNGFKSHVAVGTGRELQTTIHENLHQLSANGDSHGIIESNGQERLNVQMNEAITEMLTQRTLGEQYGSEYSAYQYNRDAMKVIESVMGEDTISQAYFQNQPNLMREKMDSALGEGTWEQLSMAFDDCLSRYPHTRESGAIRRDSIINRYMMTAEKAVEGSGDQWKNLLL